MRCLEERRRRETLRPPRSGRQCHERGLLRGGSAVRTPTVRLRAMRWAVTHRGNRSAIEPGSGGDSSSQRASGHDSGTGRFHGSSISSRASGQ